MGKSTGTINRVSSGFEQFASGCLWIVLNPLWIILLGLAAYFGWSSWQLGAEGASVTGRVVSMRQVAATRQGGVSTYAPSIEYKVDGRTYTYHSSTSSFPPAYKVGDTAALVYQQGNPDEVRADSWLGLWLLPTVLGGVGLVVAAVAIPLTVLVARRRKRSGDSDSYTDGQ